jgi:hypothetical protein
MLSVNFRRLAKIDRSEVIEAIYHFEHGTLTLQSEHIDVRGWPPGEAEKYTPILVERLPLVWPRHCRQGEPKRASTPGLAVDSHLTAVRLDDFLGDRQADARTT